jgi:predicted phage terminase large subunit-like protein
LGVERENYYLIDVFRRRLNYPDLKRAIVSHAEVFDADKIVIEGKSSGTQLIQDLQNDGVGKVVEYNPPPGADKIMRLHACSDRFESGRVVLRATRPGSTITSSSSSAFRAPNTTTRSIRPPRRSTTSANLTSSLPTSRHFRGDMNIQELSDGCCRSAGRLLISRTRLKSYNDAGHPHSELAGANASVAAIDDPSEHPAIAPAPVPGAT